MLIPFGFVRYLVNFICIPSYRVVHPNQQVRIQLIEPFSEATTQLEATTKPEQLHSWGQRGSSTTGLTVLVVLPPLLHVL